MMVGRLIGWVFILVGVAMLGRDVMTWYDTNVWAPLALGQLWYDIDSSSLNLVQTVVQRYITPYLWDPVITSILFCWAFAVFIVLGMLIHQLFRERASGSF